MMSADFGTGRRASTTGSHSPPHQPYLSSAGKRSPLLPPPSRDDYYDYNSGPGRREFGNSYGMESRNMDRGYFVPPPARNRPDYSGAGEDYYGNAPIRGGYGRGGPVRYDDYPHPPHRSYYGNSGRGGEMMDYPPPRYNGRGPEYRRGPLPPRAPLRRLPPPKPVYKGTDEERSKTTTIYVGNIPYSFVERDVAEMFERFGPIRKITIPFDRFTHKNRGFTFIEFEDRRDAEDAFAKYNEYEIEGRRLRIDWDVGIERKVGTELGSNDSFAMMNGPRFNGESRSPPPPASSGQQGYY